MNTSREAKPQQLVINEAEADIIRLIFRRYLALGSVRRLKAELDARRIVRVTG